MNRSRTFRESLTHAWDGLIYTYTTQRNMRYHVFLASLAGAGCILFGLSRFETLMVVVTIASVLTAEVVNTLAEAITDLLEPKFSPIARVAKDVAAAGVLLTALFSIAVGLIVFMPALQDLQARLGSFDSKRAIILALYLMAGVLPAGIGAFTKHGHASKTRGDK